MAEALADALATKLTISGSKGKQKAAPEVVSEDDKFSSLRIRRDTCVSEAGRRPVVFGRERFHRILRVLDGFCETGKFVSINYCDETLNKDG